MFNIRKLTFETNSSSTHSLSISGSEEIEENLQSLLYYAIESKDDLYSFLGRVIELEDLVKRLIRNFSDD